MTQKIDFVDLYEFLLKNEVEEPIAVLKGGEPIAVMVPYGNFMAMNKRQALHASELTDEDMDAILNSEIPEELKEFDHEVKK